MAVTLLHAADLHLDSPFEGLDEELAAQRRQEQRRLLTRIADTANRLRADLVLLAGDLFDSPLPYHETGRLLPELLASIRAKVFIAPGNHDYASLGGYWRTASLPNNVFVFTSPEIRSVTLPNLDCRVWGAGFTSASAAPILPGFRVPKAGLTELMVLHGDVNAPQSRYDPIAPADVAASGLDYLALGHRHGFSGLRREGDCFWAYPGCPMGRGFDETGSKGILRVEVSPGACEAEFLPMGGTEYRTLETDLTGERDPETRLRELCATVPAQTILRLTVTGETDLALGHSPAIAELRERLVSLTLRDGTRPARPLYAGAGENTLRGIVLELLQNQRNDAQSEAEQQTADLAARYVLAALEHGEVPK